MRQLVAGTYALFMLASLASAAPARSLEERAAGLKSTDARVRVRAVKALAASEDPRAAAFLSESFADSAPTVRLAAVEATGRLAAKELVPQLLRALEDDQTEIRLASLRSFLDIVAPVQRHRLDALLRPFSDDPLASWEKPLQAPDPAWVEVLRRRLTDVDARVRIQSVLGLARLGAADVSSDLVLLFGDREPEVRLAAVQAFRRIGALTESQGLLGLLSDDSDAVRNAAVGTVGELKVLAASPVLVKMLETHSDPSLTRRVFGALSRLGDPAQSGRLRAALTSADPERRRFAIEGLARLGDTSLLVPFKKDYQRERSDELRLAYCFALSKLGDSAFVDTIVLNLGSRLYDSRSRGYLLELGPSFAEELYVYLTDTDARVRAGVCEVLGRLGVAEARPHLEARTKDPNPTVVKEAQRALERLAETDVEASQEL